MSETREEWIEREARAARARYWDSEDESIGINNWNETDDLIREGWRRAVAPYYREPLRVPVDVEGLADAIRRAEGHFGTWEDISESSKRGYLKCASAALAYLNIEPCDKPEYDPNDAAFRDALKRSQEIVNNWTPEQRNHNSIGYVGLQDNERAELENLRAECKRLREEVVNLLVEISKTNSKSERQRQQLHSQCKTIESRGAEIARLENEVKRLRTQQPEMRAVKVRFDVTAENVWNTYLKSDESHEKPLVDWILPFLASHAVIDVLPGTQRREWSDADMEELAKAMRVEYANECHGCPPNTFDLAPFMAEARAALAWFDEKRGEV